VGLEQHQGVITIASCSPSQQSYEIEAIRQGSFTYALLEALQVQGEHNCATVERLYNRLRYRVAEINRHYSKPHQTPYAIVEPATKYHLILLPQQATDQDTATLREDALTAEAEGNLELAEQLWFRVLAISPQNAAARQGLKRVIAKQLGQFPTPPAPTPNSSGKKSTVASPPPPKPKAPPPEPEVELKSAKGADYTQLQKLLKAQKWKEADRETARVMLKVANREKERFVDVDSINNFPCEDLRTIDRLWIHYSKGHFGFSVQKKIWEECGGKVDYETECKLGDLVGWRKGGEWVNYSDLNFSLESPLGHLPNVGVWGLGGGFLVGFFVWGWSSIARRLVNCSI
jgi:GUN4-like